MTSSAAAELLRGYAPAGVTLHDAFVAADRATYTSPVARHRVMQAAQVLGLKR